jgi:hypothetical protein
MKQITKNAIQLLEEQRFTQTEFCTKHGLDISNFSVRKKEGTLTLKTVALIYETFDEEFNLLDDMKALVQYYLDRPHPTRTVERDLGVSYSRAKYFIREGKGSIKFLKDTYKHNKQVQELINPYLARR